VYLFNTETIQGNLMGDRKGNIPAPPMSVLSKLVDNQIQDTAPLEVAIPSSSLSSSSAARHDAISGWVDEYGDRLFSFAMVRLRNTDTCEDLVQDTFISAYKAWDTFEGRSSGYSWLVKILKNKIVDHVRKVKRHNEIPFEEGDGDGLTNSWDLWASPFVEWGGQPEAHLSKREFYLQFQKCLEQLPDKYRQAFILRVIDDLEAEEVCKVLDISSSNLWVILHRARLRLRSCLEKHWFNNSDNRIDTSEEDS
jgi:RNA polymerase sigma-70 factor (TIGR02943 family)